jgi:hypothetical protein
MSGDMITCIIFKLLRGRKPREWYDTKFIAIWTRSLKKLGRVIIAAIGIRRKRNTSNKGRG